MSIRVIPTGLGHYSVDLLRLAVRCDPHAPRLARKAVDGVEGIDGVRADARLVVTELVSNAVRHSGCAASDLIQVQASRRDGLLEILVTDQGVSGLTPRIPPERADGTGGRGLAIVANLSSRWGTLRIAGDCRVVWPELALNPANSS